MSKCLPMRAVGQVIKEVYKMDQRLVKVRAHNMSLNKRLLMYFPTKRDRWCIDPKNESKIGDIVVMKNLDRRAGKEVYTQIDYIMFPVGITVDPVTGRRCRGTEYIDEEARKAELPMREVEEFTRKRTVVKEAT